MTTNSRLAPLVSLQMFILSRHMRLSKQACNWSTFLCQRRSDEDGLLGKCYISTTSSNDVKICTVASGIPVNSQIFSNTESTPV